MEKTFEILTVTGLSERVIDELNPPLNAFFGSIGRSDRVSSFQFPVSNLADPEPRYSESAGLR